ncbi:MAG: L,D-transpeptidase family protein [Notoacmeibacter sp.]
MARSRLRDERPLKNDKTLPKTRVSARPGQRQTGILKVGSFTVRCALGKGGIGILKSEGDGKTPLAAMTVLFGFYRSDRWPKLARAHWLLRVDQHLGWCDAPDDANYNCAVKRPYPASHETLVRDDALYDCVIVLDWNMKKKSRNRGSAIFLHIARDDYKPTEGCIAVSRRDMMRFIKVMKPGMQVSTMR